MSLTLSSPNKTAKCLSLYSTRMQTHLYYIYVNDGTTEKGDVVEGNLNKINEEKLEEGCPNRGRAAARRGRPRKRALSLEPVVDKTDLMSAILGIRGDIVTVSQNQESLKGDIIKSLDSKIDELKSKLCGEVSDTKTRLVDNEIRTEKLQDAQERLTHRVSDMGSKQDDIAKDLMMQKRYIDDINLALSDQIGTVELGLAQDVETLKRNVEQNLSSSNETHTKLEDKLKDFTIELDIENGRLRMDMEAMKKVVENMHKKNIELDRLSSHYSSISHQTSCSKSSLSIPSTSCSDSMSRTSDVSEGSKFSNNQYLHMFGDTTKTVIVDRVRERENENLRNVMLECFRDMHLNIEDKDIENVVRIGAYNKNKRWPRPVKISFVDSAARDQILYFKTRVKQTAFFSDFQFSKEEPKGIREKRTKLRHAAIKARQRGQDVVEHPDKIFINSIEYNLNQVDMIPTEFQVKKPVRQAQRREAMNFYDKCRTKTEDITIVGPSLQRTIRGLAFSSEGCFLSNFYVCNVLYRGEKYNCLEQGYQATKAIICGDNEALRIIMGTDDQVLMKRTGKRISTNEEWETNKMRVMEDLLFCKFRQNQRIYFLLLNTRQLYLIESTLDTFWGSGCMIGTIALEEGCWTGQNHLGKMLMYVREILANELEHKKEEWE